MVVGELAHALGEDVLGVAAGALGAGQLFVHRDVLGDHGLQRDPVRLVAGRDVTELVLSHFSLPRLHPIEERVRLAAEAGFDGIGLYEGTTRGWRMADEWKAPWSLEVCSAAGRAEPQHHVRRIGAPIGRCR